MLLREAREETNMSEMRSVCDACHDGIAATPAKAQHSHRE